MSTEAVDPHGPEPREGDLSDLPGLLGAVIFSRNPQVASRKGGQKGMAAKNGLPPSASVARLPRKNRLLARGSVMARPGLEPGTPRFSVVRPSRLNLARLQGITWLLAMYTASAFPRTLRPVPRRYGRRRGSSAFSSVAMAILMAGGAAPHVGCPRTLGYEIAVLTL